MPYDKAFRNISADVDLHDVDLHERMNARKHTYESIHIHTYIQGYVHTYMRAYKITYIHYV